MGHENSCSMPRREQICCNMQTVASLDQLNFQRRRVPVDVDEDMEDVFEMSEMNVLEFERRVKMFTSPASKGFISTVQLMEAFSDTKIFKHLNDPFSVKTQFLFSKYISNFSLGSKLKISMSLPRRMSSYRTSSLKDLKTGKSSSLYMSVVDTTLSDIDDIAKAKLDPRNELD